MKQFKKLAILFLCVIGVFEAHSQNFLDTGAPSALFDIGVRVGLNTSNRTFSGKYFDRWNVDSWGMGFNAGAVVDLNFRDFFTIQPGIFYDTRSGDYSYAQSYIDNKGAEQQFVELGHYRTYNLTIPVMVSFRFNLAANVRWILEAGPYVMLRIHSTDGDKIEVIKKNTERPGDYSVATAESSATDYGVKIGTGISWKNRYSFNIHYLKGFNHVWKDPFKGGHNNQWSFTVGYTL